MRSAIKLTVAFMALIGLVAGNAMAQTVAADVNASIGQYTEIPVVAGVAGDSVSELEAHGEANLNVSGGDGAISGKMRVRMRDDGNPAALRHSVTWKATDQLGIELSGRSFGIGATAGVSGVAVFRGNIGDEDFAFGLDNAALMNVSFAVNNDMTVGLGVVTGGGLLGGKVEAELTGFDAANDTVDVAEAMTTVPYFSGSFGDIGVNAYMVSASGKVNATVGGVNIIVDETVDFTVTGVGVTADLGGIGIGFDYSTHTVKDIDPTNKMGIGVTLSDMGLGIRYGSSDNTASKQVDTELAVAWQNKVGKGAWGAEYRSLAQTPDAGDAATQSVILFGVKTSL